MKLGPTFSQIALSLLLVACSLGLCTASAADRPSSNSGKEVKTESLKFLQDLRIENAKRLKDVDESLRKEVEVGSTDLAKDVSTLKAEQREHRLRQDFLDRLIFQIDTHFNGTDLRAFLEPALKEMAKIDAVSSDSGLYVFMRYAAEAVNKLPEQKENILSFLEGYMRGSVSNPIPPKEFLASRNYSNGSQSESGEPLNREDVGAIADRRLHELDANSAQGAPAEPAKRTR